MKFSNFTKLLAIVFLMISFFSTKTLANYEKVFFDFSVELVNGKLIDLKEYKTKKAILLVYFSMKTKTTKNISWGFVITPINFPNPFLGG